MNDFSKYKQIDVYLTENNINNKIFEFNNISKVLLDCYVFQMNNYVWKCNAKNNFTENISKMNKKIEEYINELNDLIQTVKKIEKIQNNLKRIEFLEEENNRKQIISNQLDKMKIAQNIEEINELTENNSNLNCEILSRWG